MENPNLTFFPPTCLIDPGFWEELYNRKVNIYKLDDSVHQICASLSNDGEHSLSAESFSLGNDQERATPSQNFAVNGTILNFNLVEGFKDLNKKAYLQEKARLLLTKMLTSLDDTDFPAAVCNPRILNEFALIVFADLKSYKFTYWFGLPTFGTATTLAAPPTWIREKDEGRAIVLAAVRSLSTYDGIKMYSHRVFGLRKQPSGVWLPVSLQSLWASRFDHNNAIVVFIDNVVGENDEYKHSWGLRNVLALLEFHMPEVSGQVSILSLRNGAVRKALSFVQTHSMSFESRIYDFLDSLADSEIGEDFEEISHELILRRYSWPRLQLPPENSN